MTYEHKKQKFIKKSQKKHFSLLVRSAARQQRVTLKQRKLELSPLHYFRELSISQPER